jgi:lipid A 3-O-deacylase
MKKLCALFLVTCINSISVNAQELKIGIMQHDFDTKFDHRYEKGQNIIAEYLFDKMPNYLRAHPHIGASINSKGFTSNIYTGLTWQFDLKDTFLIEVSLGASLNNGERRTSKKRRALGSKLMFRESFSVGYLIDKQHSVAIMIDHISNADIRKPNPGLTDLGMRYGYRF